MKGLKPIIINQLTLKGYVNNGVAEEICAAIEPVIEGVIKDNFMLTDVSVGILQGFLSSMRYEDTAYNAQDITAEAVELAHQLLVACSTKVGDNVGKRVAMDFH